uniref:Candidate secreted effector n=1 Tax=Meloidogyne incognita TaxID=6306 RepID=A0A914L8F9_MELIC
MFKICGRILRTFVNLKRQPIFEVNFISTIFSPFSELTRIQNHIMGIHTLWMLVQ